MEDFPAVLLPPTVYGILEDKFYVHIFLLIKLVRILLANAISEEELQMAEKCLCKFCKLMEEYYGEFIGKVQYMNTYILFKVCSHSLLCKNNLLF